MVYSDGLAELRVLLEKLKSPDLCLTRDGKDIKLEEIARLEAEIAHIVEQASPNDLASGTTMLMV